MKENERSAATHQEQHRVDLPPPWWRSGPALVVGAVLVMMVLVGCLYAGKFWWGVQGSALASEPDAWGQFGDYFGGLLNPVVALAALGLLAWSIALQKRELAETRKALEQQARSSETLVQINALSTIIDALNSQIRFHQEAVHAGKRQLDGWPGSIRVAGLGAHEEQIQTLIERRDAYTQEFEALLDQVRQNKPRHEAGVNA